MTVSQNFKMVIVLDESLPVGLLSNTAAVLSLTLGNKIEGLIDKELTDESNVIHTGLTNTPLPILKANAEELRKLYAQTLSLRDKLLVVDITDAAQTTKNYKDYEEKLKNKTSEELKFLGVALAGELETVKSLTGNLGLLR